MNTHDLLARVGGLLMMLSAIWNFVMSGIWFISLIWVLVGALWLVPMLLAVVEIVLAVLVMIFGFNKATPAMPLLGMFISLCNFNIFGFMLEMFALFLMIGGFVAQRSEEQQNMAAYA